MSDDEIVWAAGGVVLRKNEGRREVLVVHRPKHDDWTMPKGKLDPGESMEECARREVEEETGVRCKLKEYVTDVRYEMGNGKTKQVRYWRMKVVDDDGREPDDEVDEVRWVRVENADELFTYNIDKDVLAWTLEADR